MILTHIRSHDTSKLENQPEGKLPLKTQFPTELNSLRGKNNPYSPSQGIVIH